MLRTGLQRAVSRSSLHISSARQIQLSTLSRRPFTSIRSAPIRTKPSNAFTFYSHPRQPPQTMFQKLQQFASRQFHSSRIRLNNASHAAAEEQLTLGQRMKKLSREYGWSAVGVYFLLSAVDLPFCYLLVRSVGTEKIGHLEQVVLSHVSAVVPDSVKTTLNNWRSAMKKTTSDIKGEYISEGAEMATWGVEEAEKENKSHASLGTQLALAYAIHKSFIFIRVPLAVALTPRLVKILRGWGWDIGKRTTKEAKAIKRAAIAATTKGK